MNVQQLTAAIMDSDADTNRATAENLACRVIDSLNRAGVLGGAERLAQAAEDIQFVHPTAREDAYNQGVRAMLMTARAILAPAVE